ncbi:MAG: hypothetical protein WCC32_06015 [Terriglobales bacterium]
MSLANRITLPFALFGLVLLVACGTNNNGVAPNNEGFTNGNLTGTYVFSSQGYDGGFYPLNLAGAFAANGSGGVTGGSLDAVDPNVSIATNQTITSGSYFVNNDGRGQVQLVSAVGTFVFDFVLTSGSAGASSHGLVTEFDSNGSGSGTLDLQTAIAAQSDIAGPYAFSLAGSDTNGGTFASTGAFTLNTSGTITPTGVEDFSDAGLPFVDGTLSGSALLGSGTSPGAMSLSSTFGGLTFDFYPIDTTHFKVVETDGEELLVGDVFTQTGASIPSGPVAFSMEGGVSAPLGDGGVAVSDGTGNFSSGLEDLNNNGSVPAQISFSGAAASGGSVGGRVLVNLTGFAPATQWVIYPSVGGLLMLETDSLNTTVGVAYGQTSGATLSTTQGYGFNLSAFNTSGDYIENDIAEFASGANAYTGAMDINDDDGAGTDLLTGQGFDVSFTGPDSTGRGTATTTLAGSPYLSFDFYMVDDSTALVLEIDNNQIGGGNFGLQTSGGSSVAGRAVHTMARPVHVRMSKKAKKNQGRFN